MVALLRSVAGLVLISAGVIGMVLPIIPGIPFLLAGLFILGRDHPLACSVRGHRLVRPVLERTEGWRQACRNRGRASSSQKTHKE